METLRGLLHRGPFRLKRKRLERTGPYPFGGQDQMRFPALGDGEETGSAVPASPHLLLSAVPTQASGAARRAVAGEDSLASSQENPGALAEG